MFIYSQTSGHLWDDTGKLIATGYSGHDEGRNNHNYQSTPFVGPLPCGLWTIGTPYDSSNVGPFALSLLPSGHDACGRDYFKIHGNNKTDDASQGCLIFTRPIRQTIAASNDRLIKVIQ